MKKKLTELSDIRAADKMGSNYLAGVSLPLSLSQLITIDRQTAGIQFFFARWFKWIIIGSQREHRQTATIWFQHSIMQCSTNTPHFSIFYRNAMLFPPLSKPILGATQQSCSLCHAHSHLSFFFLLRRLYQALPSGFFHV